MLYVGITIHRGRGRRARRAIPALGGRPPPAVELARQGKLAVLEVYGEVRPLLARPSASPEGVELQTKAATIAALTVKAWSDTWVDRRRKAGVCGVDDEAARLRDFVLPRIGAMALASVKRSDVRDVIAAMQKLTSKRTGRPYAPRTVIAVYAVLRTMFADAVADELLVATPCTLRRRRGELPENRDADPRWRGESIYTRTEAETLISSEDVPEDRRVLYALQLLGGLRIGEAIGRRWRDLDNEATPLGRMTTDLRRPCSTCAGTPRGQRWSSLAELIVAEGLGAGVDGR